MAETIPRIKVTDPPRRGAASSSFEKQSGDGTCACVNLCQALRQSLYQAHYSVITLEQEACREAPQSDHAIGAIERHTTAWWWW